MSLPTELGLVGDQQNVVLCIFFAPYIFFEIPSNIAVKRFTPQIWLSACISCFGIIMLCQGFVQSYSGLLATRFFLGLCETGIFPGSFYLISFWYKQEEAQRRFSVYWSTTIIAGAFGGLLASAIAKMDGIRGLSNWRWIFILEGIATVLIGILAFFCITDFPREAKWLSEEERGFILAKTGNDEAHTVPVTTRDVLRFLSRPKHWAAAFQGSCTSVKHTSPDSRFLYDSILTYSSDLSACLLHRLLPPNDCASSWLQHHPNTIALGTTIRSVIWICRDSLVPL